MGKIHSFAVPREKAKLWDELWHQFTLIAKKEHRTVGSLMAEFVEKLVQDHANGNPQFSLTDFDTDIVIPARPTVPSKYTEEDWKRFDEATRREILRDYEIAVKRVGATLKKRGGEVMPEGEWYTCQQEDCGKQFLALKNQRFCVEHRP